MPVLSKSCPVKCWDLANRRRFPVRFPRFTVIVPDFQRNNTQEGDYPDIALSLFSILLVKTFAFRRNRFSFLLNRVMMALGKESQGISQRFSHGIQHPISLCAGDKIPYHVLAGEVRLRVRELIRQICQQHELLTEQGHVSKDHVHSLVSAPNAYVCESDNAENQGPFFAHVSTGVPALKEAVLGPTYLGSRLLLCHCGSKSLIK